MDASIVGLYGSILGKTNHHLFGYISYIYPFVLIVLSYLIYKDSRFDTRRVEVYLSSILLFLSLLMIQALLIPHNGFIGYSITQSIISYIGIAGVWIVVVAIVALCLVMLFDIGFDEIFPSLNLSQKFTRQKENEHFEVKEVQKRAKPNKKKSEKNELKKDAEQSVQE